MKLNKRSLQSIVDNEAREYAIYSVENRSIPHLIDGLKPVQRFVIARALELAKGNKEKFHKLASISGGVADLGYHHGETSAEKAGAKLANTWDNNFPLLDGQGNFGSRLVQDAGAARYVFCRVSDNFRNVFKDNDVTLTHKDPEHIPPAFYLPVIPVVLINGVRGVGTGYSTNIFSHSYESVVECTKLALQGKLDKNPEVAIPKFTGKIVHVDDNSIELHGVYKQTSARSIYISEVPYKYSRETYIEVLDKLEYKGFITYDDDCSKTGFGFKVKFRKDYILGETEEERHAKIMKDFGLIEKMSQFIVVLDEHGKLEPNFQTSADLIRRFVEVRKTFIVKRIANNIKTAKEQFNLAVAKAKFIKAVIDGQIVIQGKTRAQLTKEVQAVPEFSEHADKLVAMNIYHITSDEAKKLALAARELKTELEYWNNTTPEAEYLKDLDAL